MTKIKRPTVVRMTTSTGHDSIRNAGSLVFVLIAVLFSPQTLRAEMTSCEMTYTLQGWSFVYKEYHGSGTIACQNGENTEVWIVTRGAGFTVGKSEIDEGVGFFSRVKHLSEIFGTYVAANGHAGAVNTIEGWAMTKGEVSLALYGIGRGFNIGISLDGFTIGPK